MKHQIVSAKCLDCGAVFNKNNWRHCRCDACRTNGETARSRTRARAIVAASVRSGALTNLREVEIPCVDCGARASQYEHRDYSHPLSVDPVCRSCNARRGPVATLVAATNVLQADLD